MSVDAVNRYLSTTVGREKLCRLVQYFARFYAFYLLRNGAPKEAIQRWSDLKLNIGNARKFFRLFKQFEFAQAGVKSLSIQDEVLKVTAVVKQAGMFFYYCTEAVVLANAVNFYKVTKVKDIQQLGFKCWLTALSMSIISSLYKFRNLGIRAAQLEKTFKSEKSSEQVQAEGKALIKEKKGLQKQLLQDAVDMIIPLAGLNLAPFDEGIVGLAGMTTSWLAMTSHWKKLNA
ncbi:peroxisomal biogenesis factor 11 [Fennellomyces sp. T-0311]|nr:peroxisomal biogenesis factor 11 [Fennellomyces sp. T-0311]